MCVYLIQSQKFWLDRRYLEKLVESPINGHSKKRAGLFNGQIFLSQI